MLTGAATTRTCRTYCPLPHYKAHTRIVLHKKCGRKTTVPRDWHAVDKAAPYLGNGSMTSPLGPQHPPFHPCEKPACQQLFRKRDHSFFAQTCRLDSLITGMPQVPQPAGGGYRCLVRMHGNVCPTADHWGILPSGAQPMPALKGFTFSHSLTLTTRGGGGAVGGNPRSSWGYPALLQLPRGCAITSTTHPCPGGSPGCHRSRRLAPSYRPRMAGCTRPSQSPGQQETPRKQETPAGPPAPGCRPWPRTRGCRQRSRTPAEPHISTRATCLRSVFRDLQAGRGQRCWWTRTSRPTAALRSGRSPGACRAQARASGPSVWTSRCGRTPPSAREKHTIAGATKAGRPSRS